MAKTHILETQVTTRKNPETNQIEEVETRKVHKVKMKSEDEFFMLYIKYLSPFYDLKYADDIKLMAKLMEWCDFNKGEVFLTSSRRKEITEELGIHKSNISTSLKRLREKNLIYGDKGEYKINPTVAWKGSNASRLELMRNEGVQAVFNFTIDQDFKPTKGLEPNTNF